MNILEPHAQQQPLTRAQRFWQHPVTRIFLYMLLFAVQLVVLTLILKSLPVSFKGHAEAASIISSVLTAMIAVFSLWVMTRFADKRPFASTGLTAHNLPSNIGIGLGVGLAVFALAISLMTLTGAYHVTSLNRHFHPLLPILLFFAVAVFEEVVFRGYLFQTLERRWGTGIALVSSSLIFGLAHLGNPTPGASTLQHFAGPIFITLEASILLSAAYLVTRSLWLAIGVHWAWNFAEGPLFGTDVSGTHDPNTLLYSHLTGPFWATGGVFGPEASIACLVAGTVAGILMLRLAIKRGQWIPRSQAGSNTALQTQTAYSEGV